MGIRITIAFDGGANRKTPDNRFVHRFRNFGEELYREFTATGFAKISLDEIDSAVDEFQVLVTAKRHFGFVSAFIKKTLQRHNLDDLVTVSRK